MVKSSPGTICGLGDFTALWTGKWRFLGISGVSRPQRKAGKGDIGVTSKMTGKPAVSFPKTRMRRMRRDEFSRRLMRETELRVDSLIYPVFVVEGQRQRQPVASMPGIERYSVDELVRECEEVVRLKIPAIAIFPNTSKKSLDGREAW